MREIAQKLYKKLLKRKKLLEILEVAKKLPRNLWKALGKRGGGWGGRLLNKALLGEALPRGPVPYPYIYTIFDKRYPFRVSSIEKLYPFHISASVRKEVFEPFSCNL